MTFGQLVATFNDPATSALRLSDGESVRGRLVTFMPFPTRAALLTEDRIVFVDAHRNLMAKLVDVPIWAEIEITLVQRTKSPFTYEVALIG